MGAIAPPNPVADRRDCFKVDPCMATPLMWLWSCGVQTHGSCCGHGRLRGSVVVDSASEAIMDRLGFARDIARDERRMMYAVYFMDRG